MQPRQWSYGAYGPYLEIPDETNFIWKSHPVQTINISHMAY